VESRCKTMLARFNHVTGFTVNSFTPDHLFFSRYCNATNTELLC
jgi:hypothetical protein